MDCPLRIKADAIEGGEDGLEEGGEELRSVPPHQLNLHFQLKVLFLTKG